MAGKLNHEAAASHRTAACLTPGYLVATDDEALPPDAERQFAARMGATVIEVPSGHLAMVSPPEDVAKLIASAVDDRQATR